MRTLSCSGYKPCPNDTVNGIEVKKPEGLDENSKDTEENRGKLLDFINANLKHLINGDFGMSMCINAIAKTICD